jgi:hypothetical protein
MHRILVGIEAGGGAILLTAAKETRGPAMRAVGNILAPRT